MDLATVVCLVVEGHVGLGNGLGADWTNDFFAWMHLSLVGVAQLVRVEVGGTVVAPGHKVPVVECVVVCL